MDSLAAWVHWSITLAFSPALLACTLCTASVYVKYDHSSQIPDTPSLPHALTHALPPSSKSLRRLEQQIYDTTLPYLTLQCIEWVSEWVSELHCFPCSQTASAATHIHSEQRSSGRISEKWVRSEEGVTHRVSEWVSEWKSECEWVSEWKSECLIDYEWVSELCPQISLFARKIRLNFGSKRFRSVICFSSESDV
jgi:hypothetical protein